MSDPCSSRLTIEVANRQQAARIDEQRLTAAVRRVLSDAGIVRGEISLAVVDNAEIHQLNRQFLNHDYPTDVISFPLESGENTLVGEIVASAEMAAATAEEFGWTPDEELLLYVIHGALHLVGHDDHDPHRTDAMRAAERKYLARMGVTPPRNRRPFTTASSKDL